MQLKYYSNKYHLRRINSNNDKLLYVGINNNNLLSEYTLQAPCDSIARCILFGPVRPRRIHISRRGERAPEVAQFLPQDGGSSESFRTDAETGGGDGSREYSILHLLLTNKDNNYI